MNVSQGLGGDTTAAVDTNNTVPSVQRTGGLCVPDCATFLPAGVRHLVGRGWHCEPARLAHLRRKLDRQATGGGRHREGRVPGTAFPLF